MVGHIRTAEYGFSLDKTVAYGYVTRPLGDPCPVVSLDYMNSGTYHLERMGQLLPVTFHQRSPFDPTNKRVKGIYDEELLT